MPFFLDRETGKPILPVEERPVKQDAFLKTSPTQPFTSGAGPRRSRLRGQEHDSARLRGRLLLRSGSRGHAERMMPHMNMRQSPMAYSPQTGLLVRHRLRQPRLDPKRCNTGWAFIRPQRPPGQKQYGLMAALDSRTGEDRVGEASALCRVRGRRRCDGDGGRTGVPRRSPTACSRPTMRKAGDVRLAVSDRRSRSAGGAGRRRLGVVYESRGEEYVALTMNRTVWAFKLGGTVPSRSAPPAPPTFDRLGWTGAGDFGGYPRHGLELQHRECQPSGHVGRRLRRHTHACAGESGRGADVGRTRRSGRTRSPRATVRGRPASFSRAPPPRSRSRRPGTYEYICPDHPWSIGQLILE